MSHPWFGGRMEHGLEAKLGRKTKMRHLVALEGWARAWWQDLSFPAGLGVDKGGIELSHGPGHAVPGNA